MRRMGRIVLLGSLAALIGCASSPVRGTDSDGQLEILTATPKVGLEARLTDAGRTVVLRSRYVGGALKSDILDGSGHSELALANQILQRKRSFRTPAGQPAVPVAQRFAELAQLRTASRLGRHALRRLHETLPTEMVQAPFLNDLEAQLGSLHQALTTTRLALLEEWESEARRHLSLTPDEHQRFFAYFNEQAQAIAARAAGRASAARVSPQARTGAAMKGPALQPKDELASLLGEKRFQSYLALKKQWLASNHVAAVEVLP